MNNFVSLKLLDLFRPLFRLLHIDYEMMRNILQVKLTMDQRRVPTIFASNMSNKKDNGNHFLKSLLIYALYGLVLIPFILLGENYIFQISIMFGISMFILMTSMISDFSSVLLDVKDKTILHTKPVNIRTVNAAKIVHVTIYMSMLTGAFIGIPSLVILGVQGIGYFLLFFVEVILLILFIMTITALVYIFILQFFSGEKLKDMINYVQILLSVGIIIGYQIVIRSFEFVELDFVYEFSWWHLFIPPIWFGAPFELLLNGNHSTIIIVLSILALIGPLLSIFLYYRLMPSFERNLQKLMEDTGKNKKQKWNIGALWERLICNNKEEKQFFRFASIMLSRERDFKLRVYPSLGIAVVFPFIFLFNYVSNNSFAELSNSNMHFNIYFCNIMIGVVIFMLNFSGKYKGAWVFQTTPITNPSLVFSATLKAFLLKLYLPIFLFLSVIYVTIFSVRIIPDLAVVFVTAILHTLICFRAIKNEGFPFTKPFESAQQGGESMKTFLLMFIVGMFFVVHYFVSKMEYGVIIYLVILIIVTILSWRMIFKKRSIQD
ncbi:hypothetical protein ACFSTA_01050 [Ornithinibacillus salinisoli]|uniref:ABC transporter permease n=1 Tax=Ornithinibacillus salinisoli TaxID=1848459 RepID=A0ABW4VWF4_9BACI